MIKNLLIFSMLICLFAFDNLYAQPKERYVAEKAIAAPVIDGVGNDACWSGADWGYMKYNWFSDRAMPDSSDFYCRYKVVWTPEKIHLYFEITDDKFVDDITDPLDKYWEDDLIEVFIDEDHSGGDHKCCEKAYNAFAYHTSPITYDVVDLSDDGDFVPKLFNDHVAVITKSTGSLHIVEMAIFIFDDTFDESKTNTPVVLTADKLMGFSIAYCEDDGNGREDFLATQSGGLDSWMDADLFGELLLVDNTVSVMNEKDTPKVLYPNPSKGQLYVKTTDAMLNKYEILSIEGRILSKGTFSNRNMVDITALNSGMHLLRFMDNNELVTLKFISE